MVEIYNKDQGIGYTPLPEISPYSKIYKSRLANPKFTFRFASQLVKKESELDANFTLLDLGCANGEFLYFLRDEFPQAVLHGLDITLDFISIATKLLKEKKQVKLNVGDIFSHKGSYDVVFCLGTSQIFPDLSKFISALIPMLNPGGICIVDGLFNKYDCDVRLEYKDTSKNNDDLWRSDFNIHSEKTIQEIISKSQNIEVEFFHPPFDSEIKQLKSSPHVNAWTFKDGDGNNNITNGLRQFLNPSFFVLRKNE